MSSRAWSCFSEDSSAIVQDKYSDVLGSRYGYDSMVQNHQQITEGDLLVIRDRDAVYGYGVVEEITTGPKTKSMVLCPHCHRSSVRTRITKSPRHACWKCNAEFGVPLTEDRECTSFTARYATSWFPFPTPVSVRALDALYINRDQQNAIRGLEPVATAQFLRHHAGVEGYLYFELSAFRAQVLGGHVEAVVRRRLGQEKYRGFLLNQYGATCAVTGPQPEQVLDAAHLEPFADHPVHEEDGGILLRADIHRMFDRFLLTFDPETWRTRVAPPLVAAHPRLEVYDGAPMELSGAVRPRQSLLEKHHHEAFSRWAEM